MKEEDSYWGHQKEIENGGWFGSLCWFRESLHLSEDVTLFSGFGTPGQTPCDSIRFFHSASCLFFVFGLTCK